MWTANYDTTAKIKENINQTLISILFYGISTCLKVLRLLFLTLYSLFSYSEAKYSSNGLYSENQRENRISETQITQGCLLNNEQDNSKCDIWSPFTLKSTNGECNC